MTYEEIYNMYILRVMEVLSKYQHHSKFGSEIQEAIASLRDSLLPMK